MLAALVSDAKIFLIAVIISFSLLVFDDLGVLNFPKSILHSLTIPIQYGLYQTSLGVSNQLEFLLHARRASQQNKAMTEQLAQLLSENANLRRNLAETEGFVEQQKSLSPQTFTLVPARPIGVSRYLYIDKGSADGLKLNQVVVYKDNFIGEIKELDSKKSKVMLVSDPDSRIAAFAASNKGKARGVLNGEFGSEMLLDKILHEEEIQKDDLVYTEGGDLEVPKGLILGRVLEVANRDNEVFKQAKVAPVFDVANLDVVFVITN